MQSTELKEMAVSGLKGGKHRNILRYQHGVNHSTYYENSVVPTQRVVPGGGRPEAQTEVLWRDQHGDTQHRQPGHQECSL